MNLKKTEEKLTSYLLGSLAPEEMEELGKAIEADATLRRHCDEISQTLELLSGALASDEIFELSCAEKASIKESGSVKSLTWFSENKRPIMHLAASFIMLLGGALMLMAVKSSSVNFPRGNGIRIAFVDQSEAPELSTLPEFALDQVLPDLSIPHPVENITTIQRLADIKIDEIPLVANIEQMNLSGVNASNEWAVSSIRVPAAYLAAGATKDVVSEFREIRDGGLVRYRMDFDYAESKVYILAPEGSIHKILSEIRNESMKFETMASPSK